MPQAHKNESYKGAELHATATPVGEGGQFNPEVLVSRPTASGHEDIRVPLKAWLLDSAEDALAYALKAGKQWVDDHPA